jgi:hypothetical protein
MHIDAFICFISSRAAAAAVAVDLTQTSLDPNFLTAASDLYVFILYIFLS